MTLEPELPADARPYRTELSPVSFLRRSAFAYPGKIAVVHGDRRYTYAELDERVNRLASALARAGVGYGDRVAFLCPNIPAMIEAHFAVPAIGAILVSINVRLSAREVQFIVANSGAKIVFADGEFAHLVDGSAARIIQIADTGDVNDPYEVFLAGGEPSRYERPITDEEDVIAINYTSGTTGNPKGVMYSHRGAYLNALVEALESNLRPDSVYLWVVPMFHCNGWCFTWAVTAMGGTHVCLRRVEPSAVWELFDRESVTHYNGAPTVHTALLSHPAAHRVPRPITVTVGGAPPSPALLARMMELNFSPVHIYGLTETYAPYTVCERQSIWDLLPEAERARLIGRQGVHNIVSDPIRVVDEQMKDVPRDGLTVGEVVMRGNNVMKGYFNAPAATEDAFRGGWFHSGDVAVWHPDGYIELTDRKKDIIISGGENISTIEVENVLYSHPAVLECAVVAIPDETWGERPKAFITPREGSSPTADDIIDFCRERLAHFKAPAAVEFGSLPKTGTGKIQKFLLREREWTGRAKRVN